MESIVLLTLFLGIPLVLMVLALCRAAGDADRDMGLK
jgi:hypothetical protein